MKPEECDSETHVVLIRLWYFVQRIWNNATKKIAFISVPRHRPTSQRTGHRHRKTPNTLERYPLQHSYYECLSVWCQCDHSQQYTKQQNSRTRKSIIRRHSLGLFNWSRAFTPGSEIQFLHHVLISIYHKHTPRRIVIIPVNARSITVRWDGSSDQWRSRVEKWGRGSAALCGGGGYILNGKIKN